MNQDCNEKETLCQEKDCNCQKQCNCQCDSQPADTASGPDAKEKSKTGKCKDKKADAKLDELSSQLEQSEAKLTEQTDKYLRLCAEYDNFRKRTAKEKENIYSDAISFAVTGILPIIDNFERAFAAQGEEKDKGMELIYQQFIDYLQKLKVTEMDDKGKFFDPQRHVAVMHIDDDSFGNNEIVEIFQKGYMLGDKVIRTAMVKVAN